ncbi:Uu.00g051730.m01.CDS01 [Anthostomella pinea]|uniref:Uu.00g051730.m01.CDS01 n=1 Tax=Anthostomella pinea TaxID=933095 RepID=A0AAI8VW58_9PEZI|nr:Uu.00g051730.m01.CDS01 [Anthostomella pinea]
MKITSLVILGLLALVQGTPLGPYSNSREITDPATLRDLRARQASAMEQIRNGTAYYPARDTTHPELQGRNPLLALAGIMILRIVGNAASDVLRGLEKVFGEDDSDEIWNNPDYCRIMYQTQGGGNCQTNTILKGRAEGSEPPVTYFQDQGIGKYSIRWTATDSYAWGNSSKCETEGICKPQLTFYRDKYDIVLNTWESQGEVSACQYSHGEDCKGLCSDGVTDQFSSGGNKWGGQCAIPCEGDSRLPT